MQPSKHHAAAATRRRADVAPVRTETSDAKKRLQLIRAAEDIFLAKGYHTATMNDVAKAAGMSKKTVYQLIESKAGLFTALLEYHHEKLVIPVMQDDWTINEILVQNLLSLGLFLLSPEQVSIVRLIMAEYTHSNDLGRVFHQKRVLKAKVMLENCLLQIDAASCMAVADIREMAAMLFGMALGEFHVGVLVGFRPAPSRTVLTRRIRGAVDLFLAGHGKLRN